ncbi:DsbA family protein [Palleronia sp. KMU-117]|uniref:DsbA family protein n=1 Tax=Palleronia sp. KMU-117 TaxID=3434108 RepID=UPI003D706C0B
MIRSLIAAAATATVLSALPAAAFDMTDMSDAERAAFRAEVRAYLLENPEVLMEAIAVLEQREAMAQAQADVNLIAENAPAIFEDGHSWIGGNPEGDVTLVEFMDYRCGFCRRAHPEVEALLAGDGNIRLIVKEFPILGEESLLASRFAIATKLEMGDDAYKTVHDALIEMRGEVTLASLERLAGELDLDVDAVLTGMVDPEVDRIIAENRALAQTLGITGTPTFILPGQMLRGYLPLDGMQAVVAEERGEG